jgi:predicted dehydrogenase
MSAPLRVGVIGVGHLGRHHARLLGTMPGVTLVGVVDQSAARAQEIAAAANTSAFTDWAALDGQVDAVTVAVPTESHLDVAMAFIERGVHVLVEKPLARTVEEADRLVTAAAIKGVTLAVGHTERFNPAVDAARQLLRGPRFIEAHRLGTFPERSLDIDVVFDLMIHDLDIVLSIVGEPTVSVEAVGVPVLTPRIDIANVRLRFAGGCIANLTASRISRDRIRKIRFFQPQAYLSVDYAAQEIEHWTLGPPEAGSQRPSIQGGKVEVVKDEPLRRELDDFVTAVRERRLPGVTGEAGRDALRLAAVIVERMQHGQL